MTKQGKDLFFISGDIFKHLTGGALCDRMIVQELASSYQVVFVSPQMNALSSLGHPLLTGLINNIRNLFIRFPRRALLFIDHGVYRDCFLAANLWKWLYGCRAVGIVYHLDYALPQMKGGRALRKWIETKMLRAYDFVLTISRSTAEHLERLGQPAERIALIPVSRRFGPQEYREKFPAPGIATVLFVGSIEPRKGLNDAIEALGAYRGPQRIVFHCVGSCDSRSGYVQDLISAAGRFAHLTLNLTGAVSQEDLVGFFRQADAFLFPSHWEGYGIAIEEAMCFALPVLAYEAGAVPELVEHGVTGWLTLPGDAPGLARAVAECIEDTAERQRRGRQGLAKATRKIGEHQIAVALKTALSAVGEN